MYDTSCSLQKKHSQKWSERLTFLWGHVMTSCDIAEFALCVDFLSGMDIEIPGMNCRYSDFTEAHFSIFYGVVQEKNAWMYEM